MKKILFLTLLICSPAYAHPDMGVIVASIAGALFLGPVAIYFVVKYLYKFIALHSNFCLKLKNPYCFIPFLFFYVASLMTPSIISIILVVLAQIYLFYLYKKSASLPMIKKNIIFNLLDLLLFIYALLAIFLILNAAFTLFIFWKKILFSSYLLAISFYLYFWIKNIKSLKSN